MAPSTIIPISRLSLGARQPGDPTAENNTLEQVIVEAWGQGLNVGAIVILILIVLCNYRRHVLLHKLVLLEVSCPSSPRPFGRDGELVCDGRVLLTCFTSWCWPSGMARSFSSGIPHMAGKAPSPIRELQTMHRQADSFETRRVLSSTATPLYVSYTVHNVIAWLKIKPFLPRWGARIFIGTIVLVQPYWIVESWANFEYFNMLGSDVFEKTRFFEPLMRHVSTISSSF